MKRLYKYSLFWWSLFTRIVGINPLESQWLVGLLAGIIPYNRVTDRPADKTQVLCILKVHLVIVKRQVSHWRRL